MGETRQSQMLAHILREVRCDRCGREFWPAEEAHAAHWITWRARQDGTAHSLAIECVKCHRRTAGAEHEDMLCDQQLLSAWPGKRALQSAFYMLLLYGFEQADRARIGRIADVMKFVEEP